MNTIYRYGLGAWLGATSLCALPAFADDTFLPAEQAFRMQAQARDDHTVMVNFAIADGYYLYKHRFKFAADNNVTVETTELPTGHVKADRNFGTVETYRQQLDFPVSVTVGDKPFNLTVTAQGCADDGLCYPPFRQTARIEPAGAMTPDQGETTLGSSAEKSAVPVSAAPNTITPKAITPPPQDDLSKIASLLDQGNVALIIAGFFGFGLLLAFTPCVFPMMPILSGIIVGHGANISKKRALVLSSAYVLGMAVTYTAAGVAAALTGTLLSAALQNAWVLGGFALIFVLLSLSMFGFYELQLPASLQSRLSNTANRQQGGSLLGVSFMGALSALIVGPCVAAPLAGALLYIAQTNNAVLGGAALFAMALGMGAPLILIGVAARSALPRAGAWMEGVKKAFGVMLLAVALWLVSPVLSALWTMVGWALLLIFTAIFLHALDPLPHPADGWKRMGKGVGVVALLCGAALLIGALGGSRDPLQPLAFLRTAEAATPAKTGLSFQRVSSVAALQEAIAASDKPVLVDFYADWCTSCKEMERFTFTHPKVIDQLQSVKLLQVDVTENSAADQALLKHFSFFGPPAMAMFSAGKPDDEMQRWVGFQEAEGFHENLQQILTR